MLRLHSTFCVEAIGWARGFVLPSHTNLPPPRYSIHSFDRLRHIWAWPTACDPCSSESWCSEDATSAKTATTTDRHGADAQRDMVCTGNTVSASKEACSLLFLGLACDRGGSLFRTLSATGMVENMQTTRISNRDSCVAVRVNPTSVAHRRGAGFW